MPLLEFLDLLAGLFFGVMHRLTDRASCLVRLAGCTVLARLLDLLDGVLSVAPSLLRRIFALVGNSLIGEFVVADRFSNALLLFQPPAQPCQKPDPYSLFFSLAAANAVFFTGDAAISSAEGIAR
jgi:hypothetical protein